MIEASEASAPDPGRVFRLRPGGAGSAFGLVPKALRFRGRGWDPARLPGLAVRGKDSLGPVALALWTVDVDGLILFGPYGQVRAMGALVSEAERIAALTGQAGVLCPVANDETDRLDLLQRLGFMLYEVHIGGLVEEPDGRSKNPSPQGTAVRSANLVEEETAFARLPRRDELILRRVLGANVLDQA